jgi:hypothetical protein
LARALADMAQTRPVRRDYPIGRFRIEEKLAQLQAFYRRELQTLDNT